MISKILIFFIKKKVFFENLLIISLSKYFKQGAIFLKGLLLAKFLTVGDFGVYSLFMMFLTFSSVISLGSSYSLNKKLSMNINDVKQTEFTIKRSSLILLIGNIVFFIIFFLIALNIRTVFDSSIFIIYLILILQQYNLFYENILRGLQEFKKISVGLILLSAIDLFLILFLIKNINISYILFVYLFAVLVANFYYMFNTRKMIRKSLLFPSINDFKNDGKELKSHLILGLSLLLYNLNYLLFLNTDKIVISSFYGLESLGIYTFATNIVAGSMVLLQGINYIMYPKLLKKFTIIKSKKVAFNFYIKMIITLLPTLILLNALIFISSSIFIQFFYKEYIDSINLILILYVGQVFSVVTMYSNIISIAQNQESVLIKIQMVGLTINLILGLSFAFVGLDLYFIALATVSSQVVLCGLSIKNTIMVINK